MELLSEKQLKNRYYLLVSTLIFFFLAEALTRISPWLFDESIRFTGMSKICMALIFLSYLTFIEKTLFKEKTVIISYAFLGFSFVVASYSLISDVDFIARIKYNSVYFFRYTYVFFFIILLKGLTNERLSNILKIIEIIFWVNCFFVFYGFVFEIPIFRGYGFNRFGYVGLFARTSQASYVFILVVAFYYYQWFYKKKNIYPLLIALLASFLVGTKAIYFAMINLILFHFIINWQVLRKTQLFIFPILFLLIIIASQTFLKTTIQLFYGIIKKDSLFTAIFSYRNKEFLDYISNEVIEKWTWLNYFFGSGNFLTTVRTELELADLFFFFGLSGLVIFSFTYYKLFSSIRWNKFIVFLVLNISLVSILSGNLIHSPELPLYTYIVLINLALIDKEDIIFHKKQK